MLDRRYGRLCVSERLLAALRGPLRRDVWRSAASAVAGSTIRKATEHPAANSTIRRPAIRRPFWGRPDANRRQVTVLPAVGSKTRALVIQLSF